MAIPDNSTFKVLLLSAWYPYEGDPMFGLFVRKHALAVAEKCSVVVLHACNGDTGAQKYSIVENNENQLVEILVYYKKSNNRIWGKFQNFIRWIAAYRKGFDKVKAERGLPDIVHANILTRTVLLALYVKLRFGIPYIITEHWSRYLTRNTSDNGYFRNFFTKLAIRHSNALSVVSDKLGRAMVDRGLTQKYTVIPNVIDTQLFDIIPDKSPLHRKTIVHVSCFEERSKNMSGLIKAVNILSQRRDDFVLRMIGTGQDFQKSVDHAHRLGLQDSCITFEGMKEGVELSALVAGADLMVLPSRYETFGIVVFEGLACGIPVLVSDVADLGLLINETYGKVLPDIEPETIARYIDEMLDELHKYNPQLLRNFITERFSKQKVCADTIALYSMCLNLPK